MMNILMTARIRQTSRDSALALYSSMRSFRAGHIMGQLVGTSPTSSRMRIFGHV